MTKRILIAGAGPVGLTAALEFNRRGHTVRIVDKGAGPSDESRALAINPRTLDILAPSGATERLLAAGRKLRAANLSFSPGHRVRFDLTALPHRFNFMLGLPQSRTERILIDLLAERGVAVEWKTPLETVERSDAPVAAAIADEGLSDGWDLLIAADGAHSTVRRSLGIGFPGHKLEREWGLADVRVGMPYPFDELMVMAREGRLLAMIPVEDDIVRFISDQRDVLGLIPDEFVQKDILWQSAFAINERRAEPLSKGDVFLIGDAAHIHSPAGGRGMNLGIEDAGWLAWLFDQGETGRYQALREPVIDGVLDLTSRITAFASPRSPLVRIARNTLVPLLARFRPARNFMLKRVAGLESPDPPWL